MISLSLAYCSWITLAPLWIFTKIMYEYILDDFYHLM